MKFLLLLVITPLLWGCSTLSRDGRTQVLYVESNPPGLEVYSHGRLVGTTPDHIRIKSEVHPELTFKNPITGETKKVELKTHYKWKESFGSNVIFFQLAPVGWATDLISGAAWEANPPKDIRLTPSKNLKASELKSLAIAPPHGVGPDVASELGYAIEASFKGNAKFQTLSYEYTEPYFEYYGTNSLDGLTEDERNRRRLFYELNNDLVAVSEVKPLESGYEVVVTIKNAYTLKDVQKQTLYFQTSRTSAKQQIFLQRTFGDYFHLLPNTAFINLGNPSSNLTIANRNYRGEVTHGASVSDHIGQVVERVSLSRTDPTRKNTISHWSLDFSPEFNFSRSQIQYRNYLPVKDHTFHRMLIGVGYGARLSYVTRFGTPFVEVVPEVAYSHLKAVRPGQTVSDSRFAVIIAAEVGYVYFFNSDWVMKLFTRSIAEDPKLWQSVIRKVEGSQTMLDSNASLFTGIAFGYNFGLKASHKSFEIQKRK